MITAKRISENGGGGFINNNNHDNIESIEAKLKELEKDSIEISKELDRCSMALNTSTDGEQDEEDGISMVILALKELQASEATKVIALTEETHCITSKMSRNIKKRHEEKRRLSSLIELVELIEGLEGDLKRLEEGLGDSSLVDVIGLYSSISDRCDETLTKAWQSRHEHDIRKELGKARTKLLQRLDGAMQAHQLQTNNENIDKTMKTALSTLYFYQKLNNVETGLEGIKGLVQKFASRSLSLILDAQSSLDFRFASKAAKCMDFIKGLLFWWDTKCTENYQTEEARSVVYGSIIEEAERCLIKVTRSFLNDHQIPKMAEKVQELEARQLDLMVAEIVLIYRNCFNLLAERSSLATLTTGQDSLDKLPSLSFLLDIIDELGGWYCVFESGYIQAGVKIAINMNEMATGQVSTSVEDVLFILKKCILRSIAMGEVVGIIKIIEQCKAILTMEFIPFIQRRSKQPMANGGDSIIICCNDLSMSKLYLQKIVDKIKDITNIDGDQDTTMIARKETSLLFSMEKIKSLDGKTGTPLDNYWKAKLTSAINDLDTLTVIFDTNARILIDSLYTSQVKTKLLTFLAPMFRELASLAINTVIATTPTTTNANAITMDKGLINPLDAITPLTKVIPFIESSIIPIIQELIDENRIIILLSIVKEFSNQFEKKLLFNFGQSALATTTKWTAQSIVLIERDFRRIAHYFADFTELQSKEVLLKCSQMITILNCDTKAEAVSLVQADRQDENKSVKLTDSEISILLTARADWQ